MGSLIEDKTRNELHHRLLSRKREESDLRRYQATAWLESLVGPLGISRKPSEQEFISLLRNGLVLCNAINKVQPGAVHKVVEIHTPMQVLNRESQPLPAYQYFENVRNFLVAMEELKLPAFEASNLERDTIDSGSAAKVVDCILSLKAYHDSKQMNGGKNNYQNQIPSDRKLQKLEDLIVQILNAHLDDAKENIGGNFSVPTHDLAKFSKMISSSLACKLQNNLPEVRQADARENYTSPACITTQTEDLSELENSEGCCKACSRRGDCSHKHLLRIQQKELLSLKDLLTTTKSEFVDLQAQLQKDLTEFGSQVQEMSTAAHGYYKVLNENRKLYNMVQDLKGNIRVFCRVRPVLSPDSRSSVIDFIGEDGSVIVTDPVKAHRDGRKVFQFNQVFGPSATQHEVFRDTQPLIRSVMDGYNVCIFAYGQTGSGKTYTMSGPSGGSAEDMGINFLALNDLFQISEDRRNIISYDIQVQMVEIYNEQVRDLLTEDSTATKLEIRSCTGENGLSLPDAQIYPVKSTADVLNLMKLGELNRAVGSTAMNNRSSRSHSILTIHVHGKDVSGSKQYSCLHLVDLAGSERVDKSEVTGDRLKEAQYINKSLSCLGDVITALAQKNSYIPYRNSKLTLLLQDSLGGNAKTLMFAHVSPEADSFGETVSTLKFAQRVSTVELGAARANKESTEVIQLKEQIEILKKALASKDAQNGERTPPRMRRLSIENGNSTNSDKKINTEDRKGYRTPSAQAPTRLRRLSLEAPASSRKKDELQSDADDGLVTKQTRDAEAMVKQKTESTHQKPMVKTQSKTQLPSLKLSTIPEPQGAVNEVKKSMQSESAFLNSVQTMYPVSSGNGKGSQIRKSLQTIGKLIKGSEKRNQQYPTEARSPVRTNHRNQQYPKEARSPIGTSNKNVKSPEIINSSALRRKSLSGDVQRVSHLDGKPTIADESRRNSKTPPPRIQEQREGFSSKKVR